MLTFGGNYVSKCAYAIDHSFEDRVIASISFSHELGPFCKGYEI